MKGISIQTETEQGKEYNLKIEGRTQTTVLIKFGKRFREYVNKLEKTIKKTEDTLIVKKAIFHGSWSITVIKQLTPIFDKNNIEWWLDP